MRLGLMSLLLLTIFLSCSPLKNKYRLTKSSLNFTLIQVEPNIQIAFPISKAKIDLKTSIKIENTTNVNLVIRDFDGELFINTKGKRLYLGRVKLLQIARLPAKSNVDIIIVTSIGHKELAHGWTLARAVLDKKTMGRWELSGTIRGDINGIPVWLPVNSSRPI